MAKRTRDLEIICRYAEKGESARRIIEKCLRDFIRREGRQGPSGPAARSWR